MGKQKQTNVNEYVQRTEQLLESIITKNHLDLVDVEYVKEDGNWILRVYVDKEGGITIQDCEKVNRTLSDILDQEDFIPDSYILEVSSPGLGRRLKKEKDFHRSIGRDVEVKLYQPISLQEKGKPIKAKELVGNLIGFDTETVTLDIGGKEPLTLLRKDMAMIRLAVDF